jgi:diketogulonate reductase-like aldo/keto reductase
MIPDTTRTIRELADGNEMPLLGLGVWQVPDGPECVNGVRWALELGYRHIDTAQAYRNESSVGKALKDSGVDRNEVFITTKFLPRAKDPVDEAQQSLRRLGVDQVDLYLVHWPQDGPPGRGREWSAPVNSDVNPPGQDRGQRPDLRLRADQRGTRATGRPRPHRRHRERS